MKKVDYSHRAACLVCPLRPRCTNKFRKISRLENEAALERRAREELGSLEGIYEAALCPTMPFVPAHSE